MQNLSERFAQLLVFLLPSQLAFHLWPEWALIFGIRVDYLSPTIYLTDILIALVVILHLYKRRAQRFFPNAFVVGLLLFSLINILFAVVIPLAVVEWLRVFEYLLLAWALMDNKKPVKIHTPLAIAAIYSSAIAILQFVLQRNIGGVFYWLGERPLMTTNVNMATITLFGSEYLRPYGTFPHPNVLGAFGLVVAIILYPKFKASKISLLGFVASVVLILLSFSQAIWLATGIWFFARKLTLERLKNLVRVCLVVSVILSVVFVFLDPQFKNFAIDSRIALTNTSGKVIEKFPLVGAGLGNFIVANQENILHFFVTVRDGRLRFQPVHNTVLLLVAEVGVVGFSIILYGVLRVINKANKQILLGILVVIITGIVDHYWLTLHQGTLLFVLLLLQWKNYETKS